MKRIQVAFNFNNVTDYKVEDGHLFVNIEVNTDEIDVHKVDQAIEELPIAQKDKRALIEGLEENLDERELRHLFSTGIITKQRIG